jgi:endonuclease YncB( thermonuclease family)
VVGISDGDTLTVLTPSRRQVKVRLHGVDAPEKRQAFGTQAREALAALAYGRDVNVAVEDTDHYGRTVATVTTGGANVNREQVRRGMAWWYKQYAPRDAQLRDLEATAKAAQRGLWADASPTPPWQFRRDQ